MNGGKREGSFYAKLFASAVLRSLNMCKYGLVMAKVMMKLF